MNETEAGKIFDLGCNAGVYRQIKDGKPFLSLPPSYNIHDL